jgi:hypothetical protein
MDSYSLPEFTRMTSGMDVIHVLAANPVSVYSEFGSETWHSHQRTCLFQHPHRDIGNAINGFGDVCCW